MLALRSHVEAMVGVNTNTQSSTEGTRTQGGRVGGGGGGGGAALAAAARRFVAAHEASIQPKEVTKVHFKDGLYSYV